MSRKLEDLWLVFSTKPPHEISDEELEDILAHAGQLTELQRGVPSGCLYKLQEVQSRRARPEELSTIELAAYRKSLLGELRRFELADGGDGDEEKFARIGRRLERVQEILANRAAAAVIAERDKSAVAA